MDELNSILSKMPEEYSLLPLELSGPRVESKRKEIASRIASLPYESTVGLAILLQNILISSFTDTEIKWLAKLPLFYLETFTIPYRKESRVLTPSAPLHDTGSSRIYSQIPSQSIAQAGIQASFAAANYYNSVSTKQLIISLYTRGL